MGKNKGIEISAWFQRFEVAVILLFAVLTYRVTSGNWWLFALLILVPDASMAGYLFNNKVGAVLYNVVHSFAGPVASVSVGWYHNIDWMLTIGLIWMAHVGMDRLLGYGLKTEKGFKHTHLGAIRSKK